MLLKNLIRNLKPEVAAIKIKGISFDSRSVKKGDLFVSIKGNKFDGNKFINDAIKNGAKVIISQEKKETFNENTLTDIGGFGGVFVFQRMNILILF